MFSPRTAYGVCVFTLNCMRSGKPLNVIQQFYIDLNITIFNIISSHASSLFCIQVELWMSKQPLRFSSSYFQKKAMGKIKNHQIGQPLVSLAVLNQTLNVFYLASMLWCKECDKSKYRQSILFIIFTATARIDIFS